MTEIGKDFRTRLESLLDGTPRDFQDEVNSIVDDIEEKMWNDGWDAGWKANREGLAIG